MPARTPTSKIVQTIAAVEVIQEQIAGLTEALTRLARRVQELEKMRGSHAGSDE